MSKGGALGGVLETFIAIVVGASLVGIIGASVATAALNLTGTEAVLIGLVPISFILILVMIGLGEVRKRM